MATLARLSLSAPSRVRHGAASARTDRVKAAARHQVAATARPVGAKRMLCPVRCVGGAKALRADVEAEADMAVPQSVPVRVAYELQLAGHHYLDVRTEGEFGGGHPVGAVNIPYMHNNGSGMTRNTHFLEQVSAIFGKDEEIIIGCQNGKRSLMAATELCSAGFTAVTDMAGGFSAWRENGLPINH